MSDIWHRPAVRFTGVLCALVCDASAATSRSSTCSAVRPASASSGFCCPFVYPGAGVDRTTDAQFGLPDRQRAEIQRVHWRSLGQSGSVSADIGLNIASSVLAQLATAMARTPATAVARLGGVAPVGVMPARSAGSGAGGRYACRAAVAGSALRCKWAGERRRSVSACRRRVHRLTAALGWS